MDTTTPTTPEADATVAVRLAALQRLVDAASGPLAGHRLLAHARDAADRCADRLRMPPGFTSIALAGTTGSGKSSMFNAFTGIDRSPAGILRPTTSEPYACVWGTLKPADELLDWLGVAPRRRFTRESALDANDEAPLRGMILLDLPDVDSVEPKHRAEVDRLLHLVDVVVWICDPQKYADEVVHEGYLRQLARQRSGVIVALNQTDKLLPAHLPKVGADLRQLLDDGGLADIPLVATSATGEVPQPPTSKRKAIKPKPGPFSAARSGRGYPGVATLRALLEPIISSGTGGLRTTEQDLAAVFRKLAPLAGAQAASVDADPMTRALLTDPPEAAVREYAAMIGKDLPEPWPDAVLHAALSRLAELPDALTRAEEHLAANRPRRMWLPGGKKRADARFEAMRYQETERVAQRYVVEPVRRVLAAYETCRQLLS